MEEEPFDYDAFCGSFTRNEVCNIYVIISAPIRAKLTEDNYSSAINDLREKMQQIVDIIFPGLKAVSGITDVSFMQSDSYMSAIDDKSVMVGIIPVKTTLLNIK